ncbi:50S ribosomal protein L15 [Microbacterium cremeum]|uniref:50S ribosomal protein L15 n=1 Tax=Microbacterium cremeum TaxID=2782169 RepID=UPI00188742C2|nr:50S ribosomal protein L15 [Microbacterium cremeum]
MAEKAEKNEAVEAEAPKKAPAKRRTEPAEVKTAAPKAAAEKKAPAKKAAPAKAAADKAEKVEKSEKAAPAKKAPAKKAAPAKKDAPAARPGVLKVHHLRPVPGSNTPKTRVGRGEGSKGKTAGRGTKGTKARYQVKVGFEGGQMPLHMRTPKLRGFKNPFRVEYQVVNLDKLAELYPAGGDVTVGDLVAKGAVRKNEKVKVLGTGDISVKLNVSVDKVSGSAEQKIVAAGGSVK